MLQPRHVITVLQVVCVSLILGGISNARAQPGLEPSTAPFSMDMLQRGLCAPSVPGKTATSLDPAQLAEPSLWWVRDQIAAQDKYSDKLVSNWLACEAGDANRVDVLVNPQLWNSLDFFDRYEFIQRFGTATAGYGYNLRVFDRQGTMLAAYTCDFSTANVKQADFTASNNLSCASFDALASRSFWSPTKPLAGF